MENNQMLSIFPSEHLVYYNEYSVMLQHDSYTLLKKDFMEMSPLYKYTDAIYTFSDEFALCCKKK